MEEEEIVENKKITEFSSSDPLEQIWQSLHKEILDEFGSRVSEGRVQKFSDSMKKRSIKLTKKACTLFEDDIKECILKNKTCCEEYLAAPDKDEQLTEQLLDNVCLIKSTSKEIIKQTKIMKRNMTKQERMKAYAEKINSFQEALLQCKDQLLSLGREVQQMHLEYQQLIA